MPGCTALTDNEIYSTRVESQMGIDDGGVRDLIYLVSMQHQPEDTALVSAVKTGLFKVQAVRNVGRSSSVAINTEWVLGLHEFMISDAMRMQFAGSSLTHTNAGAITVNNAGAQIGGGTGPVFIGTAGEFTPLLGSEGGMLVLNSTTADPQNLHPRRILAVNADQIDIMPEYVAGDTGEPGGPLVDQSISAGELDITIGDQIYDAGPSGQVYRNFETHYTDVGRYQVSLGQLLSTLEFSGDSQTANLILNAQYTGLDYLPQAEASIGSGFNANDALTNDPLAGNSDTSSVLINGGAVELSGQSITSLSITVNNSLVTTDNVLGADSRTCVQGGDSMITGTIGCLQEDTRLALIQLSAYDDAYTTMDINFSDTNGNSVWIGLPRIKFQSAASSDGGRGSLIEASFSFTATKYPYGDLAQFYYQSIPIA